MRIAPLQSIVISIVLTGCGLNPDAFKAQNPTEEVKGDPVAVDEDLELGEEMETALASSDEIVADPDKAAEEVDGTVSDVLRVMLGVLRSPRRAMVGASAKISSRNCEEIDGEVVVKIEGDGKLGVAANGRRFRAGLGRRDHFSSERRWSSADHELQCSEDGQHIDFDAELLQGALMSETFERVSEIGRGFRNKRNGNARGMLKTVAVSGSTEIEWASVIESEDGATLEAEKVISSTIERKIHVQRANGEDRQIVSTIRTEEDSPLRVKVKHSSELDQLDRTIESGVVIAERLDGGRVTLNFDGVFSRFGDGCLPLSGSVSGTIVPADESKGPTDYTLTFADGSGRLTIGDEVRTFKPRPCSAGI